MTKQEKLEMAADQLAIACENLANQKVPNTASYKLAVEEVEACIHALKGIQSTTFQEQVEDWKSHI